MSPTEEKVLVGGGVLGALLGGLIAGPFGVVLGGLAGIVVTDRFIEENQ